MSKRTSEQPLPYGEDAEPTEVLSASSFRARHYDPVEAENQPTKVLPLYPGLQQVQPQVPLNLAQDGVPAPAQAPSAAALTMRKTRPTTWAMIQHIFAFTTLAVLLLASIFFFIMTPVGQKLDETAFTEFSYQFMTFQSQTRNMLDLIPAIAGLLALIGLLFILIWRHRFVPALVGVFIALAANASTQLLKNYLVLKPDYGIQEATMNSAPSGHTTFAAAAGAALFLASPKKLRPTVAVIGTIFALAAGFSTVINGWHRPVDVISAILLTCLWTVLGLAILRFMRSEELDMSNTRNSGLILVPLFSIAGFFMGFCALALYFITYYDPIPGSALMAGSCMIISVASFTTSAQIALLRPQNKVRSAYTKVWTY